MTPLFAATQGSTLATGMSQSQGGSMEVGMVRQTQTHAFTPTQDLGKSQAFDWLNPSSQVGVFILFLLLAGWLAVCLSVL